MPAIDLANSGNNIMAPAEDAEVVTPSDGADLTYISRAIYVGTTGNLAVITKRGNTRTFVGVPAGAVLPIRVSRVMLTNTTASNILSLY